MKQEQALEIMKTGANVFLTGEPGSGKTHTVKEYMSYLRWHGIEPAITASTGIAATHISGMTIHSWSGIGIKDELSGYDLALLAKNDKVAKRIKVTKVLIIDEVSMLSHRTLDAVELVCRRLRESSLPFGGLQVILVGDFFQLPPIIKVSKESGQSNWLSTKQSRFAYDSLAWQSSRLAICYLEEQYRQDDSDYLELLGAIRTNNFDQKHLEMLEGRLVAHHKLPGVLPKLYTHNIDVDRVNDQMLASLPGKSRSFLMTAEGERILVEVLKRGCLSPEKLELKLKAVVMFTKNSPRGQYVNGSLGAIDGFDNLTGYPIVKLRDGQRVTAEPSDWLLEENGEVLARITQLPLRLAWAITVHKSQGMSLDGAVMDLSQVFEYGQGYVALSRVRRLSGLYLLGWNQRAFEVSAEVIERDGIFKQESESHCLEYCENNNLDLTTRHKDFIISCGAEPGKMTIRVTPVNGLDKRRLTKKAVFKKPAKLDTKLETLNLWQAGNDLNEIVGIRHLSGATILEHLEKLADQGKIKRAEFKRLIPPELEAELPVIHQTMRQLGAKKLTPLFQYLDGQYSYWELRLARLIFNKKQQL